MIIRFAQRFGTGMLAGRLAAAGRMALTNYIMTSVIFAFIFFGFGFGLFGGIGRAEAYLFALIPIAGMLAWSKPWLGRHNYGPFEWLWRSLARWQKI